MDKWPFMREETASHIHTFSVSHNEREFSMLANHSTVNPICTQFFTNLYQSPNSHYCNPIVPHQGVPVFQLIENASVDYNQHTCHNDLLPFRPQTGISSGQSSAFLPIRDHRNPTPLASNDSFPGQCSWTSLSGSFPSFSISSYNVRNVAPSTFWSGSPMMGVSNEQSLSIQEQGISSSTPYILPLS